MSLLENYFGDSFKRNSLQIAIPVIDIEDTQLWERILQLKVLI